MTGDAEVGEQLEHVERLLGAIEQIDDAGARQTASDAVAALIDLYGECLTRVVQRARGEGHEDLVPALAGDPLVGQLLLVHDLHPLELEARVMTALDGVRPYLESHGGNVDVLGVDGSVLRVRLHGSCNGCPSSSVTLRSAIEEAVLEAAPELDAVEAVEDDTGGAPVGPVTPVALVRRPG